jgi:hypothetical protein
MMITEEKMPIPRSNELYVPEEKTDEKNQENQELRVLRAMLEEERAKNQRATRLIVDLESALRQTIIENEDQKQDMKELLHTCEQIHKEKLNLLQQSANNMMTPSTEMTPAWAICRLSKAQRKKVSVSTNSLVEELLAEQKEEQEHAMKGMKDKMNQEHELENHAYQNVIKDLITKNMPTALQEEEQVDRGSSIACSTRGALHKRSVKRSLTSSSRRKRSTSDLFVLEPKCVVPDDVSTISSSGQSTLTPSNICEGGQERRDLAWTLGVRFDEKYREEERLDGGLSKMSNTLRLKLDRNSRYNKGDKQATGATSNIVTVDKTSDKTKRDQYVLLLSHSTSERRLRLLQPVSDSPVKDTETDEATDRHYGMSSMACRFIGGAINHHERKMSEDESDDCDVDRRSLSTNASTARDRNTLQSFREAAQPNKQAPPVSKVGITAMTRNEIALASVPAVDASGPQQTKRRERLHKIRSMIELVDKKQEIVKESRRSSCKLPGGV